MTNNFTVIITRAAEQSTRLQKKIAEAGFKSILLPSIETKAVELNPSSLPLIEKIENSYFTWLVFGSVNAVRFLRQSVTTIPASTNVAVVGKETGEYFQESFSRSYQLMPSNYYSEDLANELLKLDLSSEKIVIVRAEKSREVIEKKLTSHCALVSSLVVYKTIPVEADTDSISNVTALEPEETIFTFFSPSAFHSTLSSFGSHLPFFKAAKKIVIGEVTADALRKEGFHDFTIAAEQSEEGVISAMKTSSLTN